MWRLRRIQTSTIDGGPAALHQKKQDPQVIVDVHSGEEENSYSSRNRDPVL
jgi:hypothetical protein